ncbi:MAG: IS30 family transposase [Flavobacteriales bacterium]|nr:IS30 family transposase [Flavobacteriales bacterium]
MDNNSKDELDILTVWYESYSKVVRSIGTISVTIIFFTSSFLLKDFLQETIAETLNIDYYFAHPYHPWERGSNENLNGLVRQYIPKKTDFRILSDEYIKSIENKLNNRPRKRLGFETPIFVMNQLLFNQKVAFVT